MGEYFQVQDDYLDCFGDPAVIGKIGTDIQDNKCSWLVNKTLEIATEEQKNRLRANYGIKDNKAIAEVKGKPFFLFFLLFISFLSSSKINVFCPFFFVKPFTGN